MRPRLLRRGRWRTAGRDSETDAYRQVRRVGEALVDFKSHAAKDDRKRLVLHRLFINRDNFSATEIEQITYAYAAERNRLRFANKTDAEKTLLAREVIDAWPFTPELFDLLEDHILNAGAARETRDLIRILAEVSRVRLGSTALITPSDFYINDPTCGVTTLIDSFNSADQEHLREKGLRNLEAAADAGVISPHVRSVLSGIWMRSLDPVNVLGASRQELQLDLTHTAKIDDNAFAADFKTIFESSPNIHEIDGAEKRYCIRIPENPLTKLKAAAKNDKLFEPDNREGGLGKLPRPPSVGGCGEKVRAAADGFHGFEETCRSGPRSVSSTSLRLKSDNALCRCTPSHA